MYVYIYIYTYVYIYIYTYVYIYIHVYTVHSMYMVFYVHLQEYLPIPTSTVSGTEDATVQTKQA